MENKINYIKFLFKKYILRKRCLINPRTGEYDLQYNKRFLKEDIFLYQRKSDATQEELAERFKNPPNIK